MNNPLPVDPFSIAEAARRTWPALIESLLEAVCLVEPEGLRVVAANGAASRLFGIPPAELVGRDMRATASTPEDEAFWDRVAQCETGGDWRWGSQFASPTYEGGVGFASSTWRGLVSGAKFGGVPSPFARLARFFPHAFNAPRLWQIALAQWLYLRGGYWGCLQ